MAGEIGHLILNVNGDKCFCGGKGCFETTIRYDKIIKDFKNRQV